MIGVHTLYVYHTWSEDGMRIAGNHYLLIFASELSVKNIIDSYEPDSIRKFLEILRSMDIKYERILPKSLENIRYMEAGSYAENHIES
jgi:hypothetical protein